MPGLTRTMSGSNSTLPENEVDPDEPHPDQLKFVKTLQIVLCRQYLKQLKLDFTVNCTVPDNKFVVNSGIVEIDMRMKKDAMLLKKENRLDIFLHVMNKFTSSNRFPGLYMQSILELILTTNTRRNQTAETTRRLIQSASLSFENIVENFPSTWSDCANVYKTLLVNPVDIEIDFNSIHANNSDGLFHIILALLEDVLKDKSDNAYDSQPFDSFANFQQFERSESQKCCYANLSRNDKIERLFVVLNLLVKLMEIDLSVWIYRYPFETKMVMANPNTVPLIAHLLWKGSDSGQMNIIIRNILKIFTTCVWIDFPHDKVEILARLVNLVSTAVNLSENHQHENLISYPHIKSLNETFASEVTKSIEAFPYTIKFYLDVMKKIRSPIVRMLTANKLLTKFSKDFQGITVRKIYENLLKKVWLDYKKKEGESAERNDMADEFIDYPIYDPSEEKKCKKHLDMYRDEYLDLLLCQFESYVEVYRTHEIFEMMTVDSNDDADKEKETSYNQLIAKAAVEKSHKLNFNKLMVDWKELDATSKEFASMDPIYIPSIKCENLFVEPLLCTRCVEDIEYIVKLKQIIDENFIEFGNTFRKWHSVIGQYLTFID